MDESAKENHSVGDDPKGPDILSTPKSINDTKVEDASSEKTPGGQSKNDTVIDVEASSIIGREVSYAEGKLLPEWVEWKEVDYQLPPNIHTVAACVLWSGQFDTDERAVLKLHVKIAVVISNVLQTLCLCALTYFVLSGGSRAPHAQEFMLWIPEGKEVSVMFFISFVIVGVMIARRETQMSYITANMILWSWFKRFYAGKGPDKQRIWNLMIRSYPRWFAASGGFVYMMALCTRYDALMDDEQYLNQILNLLAFEFMFEIDDWIFELMKPGWTAAGVWKEDNLKIHVKYPQRMNLNYWRWIDLMIALLYALYAVCSRVAFFVHVAWISYYFIKVLIRACRTKELMAFSGLGSILFLWFALLFTFGAFCVLGDDETIALYVCYGVGALFTVIFVVWQIYAYWRPDWFTWWLVE